MPRSSPLPALIILLTSAPLAAAEQGGLDATSRGSISISASVAGLTRISSLRVTGLRDGGAMLGICARSNTKTRLYSIATVGDGRDGIAGPRPGLVARDLIADPNDLPCERRASFVVGAQQAAMLPQTGTMVLLIAPD